MQGYVLDLLHTLYINTTEYATMTTIVNIDHFVNGKVDLAQKPL